MLVHILLVHQLVLTPYIGTSPDPHNQRLVENTGRGLSSAETYVWKLYVFYTPHLEAETGKFAVFLLSGDSVPHFYSHSTYTELGVLTPHLNYISGKVAVIITTGSVNISEGSYVVSYPLGVTPGHSYWYQEQYGTKYKDEGSRVNETGTARDGGTINMTDGDSTVINFDTR